MIRPRFAESVLALACLTACAETKNNASSGETFQSTNADVHTQLATAALERGSLDAARASAREALRVDPGRVDAARILARANLLSGESQAALFAAKRATRLAPEDASTWLLLADCSAAPDESAEREHALERASSLGSSEARFVLAFESLARGDETPLAELRADSNALRPALGLIVDRLSATRRMDDALALLDDEYTKTGDETLKLTADRLRLSQPSSDSPTAVDSQDAAPSDEPEVASERALLTAAQHLKAGRTKDAASMYRDLLTREPANVEIRLALAEALEIEGDRIGAAAAYRAALSIEPYDLAATHGLARIEIESRQFDHALDRLETARNRHPRDAATLALIVLAAQRSGRVDRANIEAEKLAEIDPGGRFDHACRKLLAAADTPQTGGP